MYRAIFLCLGICCVSCPAWAQDAAEAAIAATDSGLSEFVTGVVRTHLPENYEKRKNWDNTTAVFDHLEVERKGLKIETRRKYKQANHGTWTMYRITFPKPEELQVRITNIRQLEDGRAGFDVEFSTPLDLFGRLSEWQRGIQLISLSADCSARVHLQATCATRVKLERNGKLIPDVQLEPEVISAKLEMTEFRLHRLSQLHGPLAKHLGTEAREIIEDELASRNAELPAKLNKQLAKQHDKLRLSLTDLANSKFGDLTKFVKKE